MSKKVSKQPITMTRVTGSQTQLQGQHTGTEIVESYAERLINEVFEDVERVLDGGSLPKEPLRTEYVSVQTVTVPPIVFPTTLVVPPKDESAKGKTVDAKAVGSDEKDGNSFDKWLFGGACGALAIMLLLWLASRSELQQLFVKTPATAPSAVPTAPPSPPTAKQLADAKFASYMIQSLDGIASKPVAAVAAAKQPVLPQTPTINLAPLPMSLNLADAASLAQALNRLADSLNRVAVQQPASISAPVAKQAPSASPLPSVSSTTVAKAPTPAPTTKPVASPSRTAQPTATAQPTTTATATVNEQSRPTPIPTVTQTITTTATPTPTVTVTVTASPEAKTAWTPAPEITLQALPNLETTPSEPSVTTPPVASAPVSVYTLRGILELGDRSAALFDVDGVPRRIYVGETIGSSGWTLGQVSKDGATIRRNGEVRSLGVGQQL